MRRLRQRRQTRKGPKVLLPHLRTRTAQHAVRSGCGSSARAAATSFPWSWVTCLLEGGHRGASRSPCPLVEG
eukprot:12896856-Prorocentrum_lima.AAC.1